MDSLVERLSPLRGERVLVTGLSGFKGSWLAVWLRMLGADVVGLSLEPGGAPSLFVDCGLDDLAQHHVVDLRDRTSVIETILMVRPTVVFHMAAQPLVLQSYKDPLETFDTNVTGSVNLLEGVRRCPTVRSLVFVTSDKCYANDESGRPYKETDSLGGRDPYSASKAAAEIVFGSYWESFLKSGSPAGAVSVRSGNVIGGGDWSENRLIPDCIRALSSGEPIVLRRPGAVRPWQHVLDPLKGYLILAADLLRRSDSRVGPWNFGPNPESFRTVEQVASDLVSLWGSGEVVVDAPENEVHEANLLLLDSTKAREALGWQPGYDFDRALSSTVEWYRERLNGTNARELCEREIVGLMEESR